MKQLAMSVGCILMVILASCGAPKTVERIEADTTIDLSGEWNDTDSRQVSEAMITDCLNHPWITRHTTTSEGKNLLSSSAPSATAVPNISPFRHL